MSPKKLTHLFFIPFFFRLLTSWSTRRMPGPSGWPGETLKDPGKYPRGPSTASWPETHPWALLLRGLHDWETSRVVSGVWVAPRHFRPADSAGMQEVGYAGGEDEEMWGSMGGGGVSEGEEGGGRRPPPPPGNSPPKRSPTPPNSPPSNESFLSSRPTKATTGRSPGPKGRNPPHHHQRTTCEGRPRPQTHQPPQDRHHNPPPPHQDRHPQGCQEEGRPPRGSDHRDGRPSTLPQRGREGHRPWYPRAEVRCRLGGIPGRHHPLRGEPLPPLPHPRGGRAAPGRGPGGGPKEDQTPHPHKRNA